MKTPDTTPRTETEDEIEKLSSEYADRRTLKQGYYDDEYVDRLSMRHEAFAAGARHYAEKLEQCERERAGCNVTLSHYRTSNAKLLEKLAGLEKELEGYVMGTSSHTEELREAFIERDAWKDHAQNLAWSCGRYFDTQDGVWPQLADRLDALKTSAKHHIERFYKFKALRGDK